MGVVGYKYSTFQKLAVAGCRKPGTAEFKTRHCRIFKLTSRWTFFCGNSALPSWQTRHCRVWLTESKNVSVRLSVSLNSLRILEHWVLNLKTMWCIPLDSTAYLHSRSKIKYIFINLSFSFENHAVLHLLQTEECIHFSYISWALSSWASDLSQYLEWTSISSSNHLFYHFMKGWYSINNEHHTWPRFIELNP